MTKKLREALNKLQHETCDNYSCGQRQHTVCGHPCGYCDRCELEAALADSVAPAMNHFSDTNNRASRMEMAASSEPAREVPISKEQAEHDALCNCGAKVLPQPLANAEFDTLAWLKEAFPYDWATFTTHQIEAITTAYAAGLTARGAQHQCDFCGKTCVPNTTACKDCTSKHLTGAAPVVAQAELSEKQVATLNGWRIEPANYDLVARHLNALLRSGAVKESKSGNET